MPSHGIPPFSCPCFSHANRGLFTKDGKALPRPVWAPERMPSSDSTDPGEEIEWKKWSEMSLSHQQEVHYRYYINAQGMAKAYFVCPVRAADRAASS